MRWIHAKEQHSICLEVINLDTLLQCRLEKNGPKTDALNNKSSILFILSKKQPVNWGKHAKYVQKSYMIIHIYNDHMQ